MSYGIHVSVSDDAQLSKVLSRCEKIGRIFVSCGPALKWEKKPAVPSGTELFLSAPHILRKGDEKILGKLLDFGFFDGVLIRDLQALGFLNEDPERFSGLKIVSDSSLYVMNREAASFYREASVLPMREVYVSTELTGREIAELTGKDREGAGFKDPDGMIASSVVYGHLPSMVSANCVRKTSGKCLRESSFTFIKDRMNRLLPVYCDCIFCYNVIYNAVPLSLHKMREELLERGNARIDLTIESPEEAGRILDFYLSGDPELSVPYSEYTTGHYRKGVE